MDTFHPQKRRDIMRRVRSKDTIPEKVIRALLHKEGFRFRIHRTDLPGKPDIILPKYKTVIFVHGCFWHRHENCKRASTPSSRLEYWLPKFQKTIIRDIQNIIKLEERGWKVIVIWECEIKDIINIREKLRQTLCRI